MWGTKNMDIFGTSLHTVSSLSRNWRRNNGAEELFVHIHSPEAQECRASIKLQYYLPDLGKISPGLINKIHIVKMNE